MGEAGWFRQDDGRLRYWDGTRWTSHFTEPTDITPGWYRGRAGDKIFWSGVRWESAASTATTSRPVRHRRWLIPLPPFSVYFIVLALNVGLFAVVALVVGLWPHGGGSADLGPPGDLQRATVIKFVDGDTVYLHATSTGPLQTGADSKVRLLEIDTPESVDPRKPVACYSKQATSALQALLPLGSEVGVAVDEELEDRYGRPLVYLWTKDDRFVNLEMVQAGFARAVLFEPNDRYIDEMRGAERRAREQRKGLWGACSYFGAPADP